MRDLIDKIIVYLTFSILIISVYLSFTGTWMASDINKWQITIMGENKFYPIITAGILFIPPMLILLPIKFYMKKTTGKNG